MIHAFLAGFAGCIGVLVAVWCWHRIATWPDRRAVRRERRRLIAEERDYWRRVERDEREQQRLARREQRRLAGTKRGDWPSDIFGWMQVSLSVVFYLCLVGGLIAAFTG